MKQRGPYRGTPGPWDGRWVVTFNRAYVWSGKAGWLLYVIRCKDKSLYCGITNDLPGRLRAHDAGKGAKYTRPKNRRPVRVVYTHPYPDRASASKAEYAFKQLSKAKKEAYVRSPELTSALKKG